MKKTFFLILVAILAFSACKKEEPIEIPDPIYDYEVRYVGWVDSINNSLKINNLKYLVSDNSIVETRKYYKFKFDTTLTLKSGQRPYLFIDGFIAWKFKFIEIYVDDSLMVDLSTNQDTLEYQMQALK